MKHHTVITINYRTHDLVEGAYFKENAEAVRIICSYHPKEVSIKSLKILWKSELLNPVSQFDLIGITGNYAIIPFTIIYIYYSVCSVVLWESLLSSAEFGSIASGAVVSVADISSDDVEGISFTESVG